MQYRYFSKRSQMVAVLKADVHRIRTLHPERLRRTKRGTQMVDRQVTDVVDVQSDPPSPRELHYLAWHWDDRVADRRRTRTP